MSWNETEWVNKNIENFCEICDIQCVNKKVFVKHVHTDEHKKKLHKWIVKMNHDRLIYPERFE